MQLDQLQTRVIDTFKFRAGQEMILRNDEICRLKEKLALFRSPGPNSDHPSQAQHCEGLRQQLFQQSSDARLLESKMRTNHAKLLQSLRQAHEAEIQKLHSFKPKKPQPRASSDPLDGFLEEMRPRARNSTDSPQSDPTAIADRHRHLEDIQAQCAQAESRLSELQTRLAASRKRFASDVALAEPISPTVIANLRDVHERQIAKLNTLIEAEERKIRKTERALKRESEKSDEDIQEQLAKIERETETWRILREGSEDEKQSHLEETRTDSARMQKEIGRLDFMLYGRRGQFQSWRSLPHSQSTSRSRIMPPKPDPGSTSPRRPWQGVTPGPSQLFGE
jgi:hypothetical protein